MKTSKKIFSLALALVMSLGMVFSFGVKASAEGPSSPAGDLGTITITNAEKGPMYYVYQVFGATYNAGADATAWTLSTNSVWYNAIVADADAPFTFSDGTDNTFKYVTPKAGVGDTAILNWLKNNMPANAPVIKQAGGEGKQLTFDVPYGYYLIKSEVGTGNAVTIDKVNPDATVVDKNINEPETDDHFKKIELADGRLVDDTTAKVGDTVNYQVKLTTVNWVNKEGADPELVTKYVVKDNPTNLAIDENSVKVWVDDGEITNFSKTLVNGVLTVTVPWTEVKDGVEVPIYQVGAELKVTYQAEVLAGAVNGTSATNNAAVSWNEHAPFDDDDTEVKNYKFDIDKVDGKDASKKLAGAEFKLLDKDQNEIELVKVGEGTAAYYRPATTEEKDAPEFAAATPVTDANGYFEVQGLGNGTYYLKETHAPDGYTKREDPMQFTIQDADKVGDAKITVQNNKGAELPSTGGMGTTIFYTVGGILVVGAAVLLITKKRMDGAQ